MLLQDSTYNLKLIMCMNLTIRWFYEKFVFKEQPGVN